MKPVVSVIIPSYNAERYIAQAVASALQQQDSVREVIVVDDASTDGTLAAVQRITDPRVRVLTNDTNRGPSFSRNRALDVAEGPWIALLDADDWFAPRRLQRLLEVAAQEQADLVADDLYMIRDGASTPFTTQFRSARPPLQDCFVVSAVDFIESGKEGLSCLRLPVTKPIMRKAFLDQHAIRYDESIRYCEDFRLYLLCLLHGARFVVLPEPYYYRRRHEASITAGDIIELLERELQQSPALLTEPTVCQNEAVLTALHRRYDQKKRHLAFRRVQRAIQQRALGTALHEMAQHPQFLSFIVQRMADRFQHRLSYGSSFK